MFSKHPLALALFVLSNPAECSTGVGFTHQWTRETGFFDKKAIVKSSGHFVNPGGKVSCYLCGEATDASDLLAQRQIQVQAIVIQSRTEKKQVT